MGCISISAARIGDGITFLTEKLNESLKISVGVVCSISEIFVLDVSSDTVWLTPSNNFSDDFMIISNVNWLID